MTKNKKICITLVGIVITSILFSTIITFAVNKGFMIAIADLVIAIAVILIILSKTDFNNKAQCNAILLKYSMVCKLVEVMGVIIEQRYDNLSKVVSAQGALMYFFGCLTATMVTMCIFVIYFFRKPESEKFKVYILAEFFITYFALAFIVRNIWALVVVIPLLSIYILFDEKKLLVFAAVLANLANGICAVGIISNAQAHGNTETVWVLNTEIILFALYTLALMGASSLNKILNKEKRVQIVPFFVSVFSNAKTLSVKESPSKTYEPSVLVRPY